MAYKVKIFQGFRVEDEINGWLEKHKGIDIVTVLNNSIAMNLDVYQTVMIFYKEMPSLRYLKREVEK